MVIFAFHCIVDYVAKKEYVSPGSCTNSESDRDTKEVISDFQKLLHLAKDF